MQKILAVCLLVLALLVPAAAHADQASSAAPARRATAHYCHGHRATIVGNARNNTLIGTRHRDVIWAGGGRDRILGRGGNDLICAGPGSDVIDGMGGLDAVYGGPGTDWCIAWSAREHSRYHHGCEVHVHSSPPPPPSRQGAPAARVGASQRIDSTQCGSQCWAGVPQCSPGRVSYADGGAQAPRVVVNDTGYIAIDWEIYRENSDGTFTLIFSSGWAFTGALQGGFVYPVTPSPASAAASNFAVSYAMVYFSYSRDGANWSPVQSDLATSYSQVAYGFGEAAGGCFT